MPFARKDLTFRDGEVRKDINKNPKELQNKHLQANLLTSVAMHSRGQRSMLP